MKKFILKRASRACSNARVLSRESDVWSELKRALVGWHLMRIEAKMPLGLPDVHCSVVCEGKTRSGWIELKHLDALTGLSDLGLSPEQALMLYDLRLAGQSAWLVVWIEHTGYVFDQGFLRIREKVNLAWVQENSVLQFKDFKVLRDHLKVSLKQS